MPRVNLPHTNVTRAGTADGSPVTGDPVNFHSTANDGRVWIEATNTGASTRTVTVHLTPEHDGQTVTPRVYSLGAGVKRRIGPWPPGDYGDVLAVDVNHAEVTLTAYHLG